MFTKSQYLQCLKTTTFGSHYYIVTVMCVTASPVTQRPRHEGTVVQSPLSRYLQWPGPENQEVLWRWLTQLWERWVWWRYLNREHLGESRSITLTYFIKISLEVVAMREGVCLCVCVSYQTRLHTWCVCPSQHPATGSHRPSVPSALTLC